jgi:hypothetical protein
VTLEEAIEKYGPRLYAAARFVIKQRRGIPDDEKFTVTKTDFDEFFTSLTEQKLEKLCRIAATIRGTERPIGHS